MKTALDWALPAACVAVVIGLPLLWRWRDTRKLRRDYQQGVREVGEDTLDMLARAAREKPHELHGWGPGETAESLIIRLPPRIARDRCGCLWLEGGLWSPCIGHDPGFEPPVERWASEMGQ